MLAITTTINLELLTFCPNLLLWLAYLTKQAYFLSFYQAQLASFLFALPVLPFPALLILFLFLAHLPLYWASVLLRNIWSWIKDYVTVAGQNIKHKKYTQAIVHVKCNNEWYFCYFTEILEAETQSILQTIQFHNLGIRVLLFYSLILHKPFHLIMHF